MTACAMKRQEEKLAATDAACPTKLDAGNMKAVTLPIHLLIAQTSSPSTRGFILRPGNAGYCVISSSEEFSGIHWQ